MWLALPQPWAQEIALTPGQQLHIFYTYLHTIDVYTYVHFCLVYTLYDVYSKHSAFFVISLCHRNIYMYFLCLCVLFSLCLSLTGLVEREGVLVVREGEVERERERREEDLRQAVVTHATQKQ